MKATRPIFLQADPKLDVESRNTKKINKNFTKKKIWVKKKFEALTTPTFFKNLIFFRLWPWPYACYRESACKKLGF
jgi:hypothetical protein